MAFNASFDIPSVLNRILSTPSIEQDIPDDLKTSERVQLLNGIKSQIISGVESHYRQNFGEVLEQTSRIMGMQSELNNKLEERNAELRSNFLSTYEACQTLKSEKEMLQMKLEHEAEKYKALLEHESEKYKALLDSHMKITDQLFQMNKISFDNDQTLCDMHDTVTRLSLMIEVSRSMSVYATPVAQIHIPVFQPQFDEVPQASPATPVSASDGAEDPVNPESGVLVAPPPPTASSLAGEIEQLSARMGELEAEAGRTQALQMEVVQLRARIQQLEGERDGLREQLGRAQSDNFVLVKQCEEFRGTLCESNNELTRALEQHAGTCLDLSGLRKEHDDLKRQLRFAEDECGRLREVQAQHDLAERSARLAEKECERLREEKALALKSNKHLEATNKELRHRFKHIKDNIAESVKAEMRKEWDNFYVNCKIDAEAICQTGVELAEEAHQAQVRFYDRTTDMGVRYIDMINTAAQLREYLVKNFSPDAYKHEPPALQESLLVLSKQIKSTVAHNHSLQEQLRTQDIFIHAIDQVPLYNRCVELEMKLECSKRDELSWKEAASKKDKEILALKAAKDDYEHRLRIAQQDVLFQARLAECDGRDTWKELQKEFKRAHDFA